ncbi:hypothetical protein Pan54_03100 [Rubinisphaera italica]|uniref:Uncharacterized protein n=1 Tax=Rubinisphaera italica TaxID=2527969 RepID=A0A5C5XCG3_9PLAN|nr:hypothetical protein Pan54_03100 [Rubinisphaera italica]
MQLSGQSTVRFDVLRYLLVHLRLIAGHSTGKFLCQSFRQYLPVLTRPVLKEGELISHKRPQPSVLSRLFHRNFVYPHPDLSRQLTDQLIVYGSQCRCCDVLEFTDPSGNDRDFQNRFEKQARSAFTLTIMSHQE